MSSRYMNPRHRAEGIDVLNEWVNETAVSSLRLLRDAVIFTNFRTSFWKSVEIDSTRYVFPSETDFCGVRWFVPPHVSLDSKLADFSVIYSLDARVVSQDSIWY